MISMLFPSSFPQTRGPRGNRFAARPWTPAFARATKIGVVLAVLLLAGCAGTAGGGWVKPGADNAATASAYRDCRALTDTATRTDSDIDQDIAASRASDLQHSSIVREQSENIHSDNTDRADAILSSCMQAKGFTRGK
jgi:hypothetical protein